MLMMGTCLTGVSWAVGLVQHAQMETEWVVGWTSMLVAALVMSMCSLQRMGNRLAGKGRRRDKKRWKGDDEEGEKEGGENLNCQSC